MEYEVISPGLQSFLYVSTKGDIVTWEYTDAFSNMKKCSAYDWSFMWYNSKCIMSVKVERTLQTSAYKLKKRKYRLSMTSQKAASIMSIGQYSDFTAGLTHFKALIVQKLSCDPFETKIFVDVRELGALQMI